MRRGGGVVGEEFVIRDVDGIIFMHGAGAVMS